MISDLFIRENMTFLCGFIAILVPLLPCSKNSMLPSCSLVVHDVQCRASVLHNAITLLLLLIVKGSLGKFAQIECVFMISGFLTIRNILLVNK